MTDPVNPSHRAPSAETPPTQAHTDPVVQRIIEAGAGLEQLVNGPLNQITERLESVHAELQAALAAIDAPAAH